MGEAVDKAMGEVDKAMAAVAHRQHGYITRCQLLKLGLGSGGIKYRVELGRLIAVYAGVYAVGHVIGTPVARAAAAVLACGNGALLSHGSAASLWGFDKRWGRGFEVTATWDRARPGIKVHRTRKLARRDITRQLGIRVTSPARTVLDIAPRLTDKRLTRVVNDARLARRLSLDDLSDVLGRNPRHPGTRRLMPFVTKRRGMTRSELEDAFVAFTQRYGLPEPDINTRANRRERDMLFRAEKVIVELDGYEFHSDRRSFEDDRDRDADMLVQGVVTVRVTEERLTGAPAREAARLHAILEARRRAA